MTSEQSLGLAASPVKSAAFAVKVPDKEFGFRLRATRDFEVGEVVLREAPLILGVHWPTHCVGCGKDVSSAARSAAIDVAEEPCGGCEHARFCSSECAYENEDETHAFECAYWSALNDAPVSAEECLLIRTLGLKDPQKIQKFLSQEAHGLEAIDPPPPLPAGRPRRGDRWSAKGSDAREDGEELELGPPAAGAGVGGGVVHPDEILTPARRTYLREVVAAGLQRAGLARQVLQHWSFGESQSIAACILGVWSRLHINHFCVSGHKRVGDTVAGVFVDMALLEHSCRPNCDRVFLGTEEAAAATSTFTHDPFGTAEVRAITPIKKGEFLSHSYYPANWPTLERWQRLRVGKCIARCGCAKCRETSDFADGRPDDASNNCQTDLQKATLGIHYKLTALQQQAMADELTTSSAGDATSSVRMVLSDQIRVLLEKEFLPAFAATTKNKEDGTAEQAICTRTTRTTPIDAVGDVLSEKDVALLKYFRIFAVRGVGAANYHQDQEEEETRLLDGAEAAGSTGEGMRMSTDDHDRSLDFISEREQMARLCCTELLVPLYALIARVVSSIVGSGVEEAVLGSRNDPDLSSLRDHADFLRKLTTRALEISDLPSHHLIRAHLRALRANAHLIGLAVRTKLARNECDDGGGDNFLTSVGNLSFATYVADAAFAEKVYSIYNYPSDKTNDNDESDDDDN